MTYVALDKAGITYKVFDITQAPEAAYWLTDELGYVQAPVVVDQDSENHWSGFRPDHINALAAS